MVPTTRNKYRKLSLSVVSEWRMSSGASLDDIKEWGDIRRGVLQRDGFSCYFCGFTSPNFMEVHHMHGRHDDQSPENLVTLCPFCHSCMHIGFSGMNGKGFLLELEHGTKANQSRMHRMLLDSLWERGNDTLFYTMVKNLPVKKNHGADGLVMLANVILEKQERGENPVPPGHLLFMPEYGKYDICDYIVRRRKLWLSNTTLSEH